MSPKYLLSSKEWANFISDKIGYLNQILSRAVMYRALPTKDPKKFELQYIVVKNGEIAVDKRKDPSFLTLEKDPRDSSPLEGAKISKAVGGESGDVYFPYNHAGKIEHGMQYAMARFVYESKDNFSSTWENDFISGDYLAAYHDEPAVVLKLEKDHKANFVKNKSVKTKEFTNAKSAKVVGKYNVSEPERGMFVFSADKNSVQKGSEAVDGRIGLFVDIFDASKTELNQHVVELIIVNPNDSKDFLMYYEHPRNGEEGK
jgi:hypothetical protein